MAKTANPLRQAVNSAIRANELLRRMFGRLGNSEHPNGFVLSAYRNARRAMATALNERNPELAAAEVLAGLRMSVDSGMRSVLLDVIFAGAEEAERQLGFYEIPATVRPDAIQRSSQAEIDAAVAAVRAVIAQQEAFIKSVLQTGADRGLILGDEERMGALAPAPVTRAGTYWTGNAMWNAFERFTGTAEGAFQKQCVAALDHFTTDCCLRAHAQIVPMDKPFHLTGTPRFADYVDYPPFHIHCRTAIVLYNPAFDDGISDEMRDGADQVLAERAAGINRRRRPADAYA